MNEPDFVRIAITKHLKPVLATEGFYRRMPKTFIRIRGELVDVISFQLSQWGGKSFYIYHFCNLLAHPDWERTIQSYTVGNRIDNGNCDWYGENQDRAEMALIDVAKFAKDEILPWFDEIVSVKDYIVKYFANPDSSLHGFSLAIGMLLVGETNRPYWILDNLINKERNDLNEGTDFDERLALYVAFQKEINNGTFEKQLHVWREQCIDKNKLQKAVVTSPP